MDSHLKDLEEVRAVIQLYVEGANGDVEKLRQAFHPDARMMGHIGPMETYFPITDFFRMVERQPGLAGPNYKADVRTIDIVGDAGVAVHAPLTCTRTHAFAGTAAPVLMTRRRLFAPGARYTCVHTVRTTPGARSIFEFCATSTSLS